MSTFHSTIDALLSWKEMNVAAFDPEPLPKETRESMKAISRFLSAHSSPGRRSG